MTLVKEQYGPWAVIAGGSEGVGAAFAHMLAAEGLNLVLLARKTGALEETARSVRATWPKVSVRMASVDLTADDMLDQVRALTDDLEVGMLIYNAGAESTIADFHDRPVDDSIRMVGLNVVGPTRLCHHFGGAMRQRRRGGIILTGTSAGYVGGPRMTMYSATKAFDRMLAEGLWYELAPYNVHVLGLMLGATRTPAMTRMGTNMDVAGFEGADPAQVAREGLDHIGKDPVWHATGTEAFANHLQSLPRAEAIGLLGDAIRALGL